MERWDIYDKNKVRTGRIMERNHFNLADDEYHLTVLGVIRRPDGRFLITKRVMTKAWAPGWWEVSGGAAQAGEESEEAVRREVLEETGLDVKEAEGGYVFTYHRENPGEGDNYFVDVYRYTMDVTEQDVHLQTEETDGCRSVNRILEGSIAAMYAVLKRRRITPDITMTDRTWAFIARTLVEQMHGQMNAAYKAGRLVIRMQI